MATVSAIIVAARSFATLLAQLIGGSPTTARAAGQRKRYQLDAKLTIEKGALLAKRALDRTPS